MKQLDALRDFWETEEGKKSIEEFVQEFNNRKIIEERHVQVLHDKFGDSIDSIIEKIISKYESDKYKDRWYKRSIEPECMLYNVLYDYAKFLNSIASNEQIEQYGSEVFGGDVAYILGSYFLQIIHGQGSAVIVVKMD